MCVPPWTSRGSDWAGSSLGVWMCSTFISFVLYPQDYSHISIFCSSIFPFLPPPLPCTSFLIGDRIHRWRVRSKELLTASFLKLGSFLSLSQTENKGIHNRTPGAKGAKLFFGRFQIPWNKTARLPHWFQRHILIFRTPFQVTRETRPAT